MQPWSFHQSESHQSDKAEDRCREAKTNTTHKIGGRKQSLFFGGGEAVPNCQKNGSATPSEELQIKEMKERDPAAQKQPATQ